MAEREAECTNLAWLEPAIQLETCSWSAVNLKKTADLDEPQVEPMIWSRDTGQRIPCSDRCQLTITWMSNIKDVRCKLGGQLEYGHHVGLLLIIGQGRRRGAVAPTSNTASHDYHEKSS